MALTKHVYEFPRPNELTQADFFDELVAFAATMFSNDDRAGYEAMIETDGVRNIRVLLWRDVREAIQGFVFVRHVETEVDGQSCDVFRAVAAMTPTYRRAGKALGFGISTAVAHKLRHPLRRSYYLGSLIHPSAYYMFARYTPTMWPNHRNETPPAMAALMARVARASSLELVAETQPLLAFEAVMTRETEAEAAFWRAHRRPEVQSFLRWNPDYDQGRGLVVLIPLSAHNLTLGTARYLTRRLRRWLRSLI